MTNDIYKILGENISLYRRKHGMKLETLAKKAGISVSFLNNIEKGKRKPTLYSIEKIANALDCPLASLLSYKSSVKYLPEDARITFDIIKIINKKSIEQKRKILEIIKIL